MATIKELLLKIPEYGQLAVQYCIEQDMREGVSVLTMEKKSIKGALISAFNWYETEQGHDFWYNIYKKINE